MRHIRELCALAVVRKCLQLAYTASSISPLTSIGSICIGASAAFYMEQEIIVTNNAANLLLLLLYSYAPILLGLHRIRVHPSIFLDLLFVARKLIILSNLSCLLMDLGFLLIYSHLLSRTFFTIAAAMFLCSSISRLINHPIHYWVSLLYFFNIIFLMFWGVISTARKMSTDYHQRDIYQFAANLLFFRCYHCFVIKMHSAIPITILALCGLSALTSGYNVIPQVAVE